MQNYNKTTAAVIAGALVTIIIAAGNAYSEPLKNFLQQPGVQAALQTLITAGGGLFIAAEYRELRRVAPASSV